jgi:hypothetical protein
MRSSLRRQLLHLATDLSALAANPDDLGHGFDLLTRSYATPVADAARATGGPGPARPSCRPTALATTPGCTNACATPTTSGMWCAAAHPRRPEKRR